MHEAANVSLLHLRGDLAYGLSFNYQPILQIALDMGLWAYSDSAGCTAAEDPKIALSCAKRSQLDTAVQAAFMYKDAAATVTQCLIAHGIV